MNTIAPLLHLTQVQKDFYLAEQKVTVLKAINLTIRQGEMIAILGPSGSGKSTLMHLLGCLDRPSQGSYQIAGKEVQTMTNDELAILRREHFGFIFQHYHLLPRLSALENVEIPATYTSVDKKQRHLYAQQLLERLGLSSHLHHRPNQLSGGQQQRVSIARALMNGAQIILADEPTGALDSHSGAQVMQILKQLHQDGHTIIIVTHDLQVASHAERIIEMHDGEITVDKKNAKQSIAQAGIHFDSSSLSSKQNNSRKYWAYLFEIFKTAWVATTAHSMRAILTMLGIVIGIAAVVSVVGLGQSTKQQILNQINAMGTNTIAIYPGYGWGESAATHVQNISSIDLALIQAQHETDSVSPIVSTTTEMRLGNIKANVTVHGVSEQYFRVRGINIDQGGVFNKQSIEHHEQVAVIDHRTYKKFFKAKENALGQTPLLGTLPVIVIGVTQKSKNIFFQPELELFMPYTTVMARLIKQNYFQSLIVRVRDGIPNSLAEYHFTQLIKQRHGTQDFSTYSSDSIRKTAEQSNAVMTLFISAIAAISLIVGGIGVMNIMLVSVIERTREIGIRMAVGARRRDIMYQFLIEAILVCLFGGVLGITLSYFISIIFTWVIPSMTFQLSITAIVFACLSSTMIGVIFGFLPARNAARLHPVEALARE